MINSLTTTACIRVLCAGRVLRGQPFMATRRQQLSYRVMVMQGFLVAFLLGLSVGLHLFWLARHLIRQQTVAGATSGFTLVSCKTWVYGVWGMV